MARFRLWQVVALWTVMALALGSLAQTTWLWQCRYASTVLASTAGMTRQMPCRMVGADMASMPCCRHKLTAQGEVAGAARFQAPACDPKLVTVAVDAAARNSERHSVQLATADAPGTLPSTQAIVDNSLSTLAARPGFVATSTVSPDLSPPSLRGPPA